jgi:hypothetical protein
MNSSQLSTILHSNMPASFIGVFPSDQLPKTVSVFPACFIINTDPASQPGSHWVAIYVDSKEFGEYFDSYGKPPDVMSIVKFLNENCRSWHYNTKRIQGSFSSVCGHYCVYFLVRRLSGTPMSVIRNEFSGADFEENDHLVTEWVNENFELNTDTYNVDFIANQICRALFSK